MPMIYYKCECGQETRKAEKVSRANFRQRKDGSWTFDPTMNEQEPVRTISCPICSKSVIGTEDPDGVATRVHFNWIAD